MKNARLMPAISKNTIPYLYFIGVGCYWLFDNLYGSAYFNPIAALLVILLICQAKLKNNLIGFCGGLLLTIFSIIMFMGVISEFRDFAVSSTSTRQLLLLGSAISAGGLIMGILMTANHLKNIPKTTTSTSLA